MRKSISLSAYILLPCIFGMAAVAKPMVFTLLSEKWKDCIIFLQIACIGYAFLPIQTANLTAINAVGRSDIYMKLEIIKRSLTILMLIVCAPFGIYALCIGQAGCNILFSFINAFPNKKLLNYHYHEQLEDLLPALIMSLLMATAILSFNRIFILSSLLQLVIDILVGIFIYIILSTVSRNKSFLYLLKSIKK